MICNLGMLVRFWQGALKMEDMKKNENIKITDHIYFRLRDIVENADSSDIAKWKESPITQQLMEDIDKFNRVCRFEDSSMFIGVSESSEGKAMLHFWVDFPKENKIENEREDTNI